MSSVHTEHYQPLRPQDVALQRLDAGRKEIILLSHLIQASLVVERSNPLRQAVVTHRTLVRNVTATIVILLSLAAGLMIPYLSEMLGR
jgi:hypothetical protein